MYGGKQTKETHVQIGALEKDRFLGNQHLELGSPEGIRVREHIDVGTVQSERGGDEQRTHLEIVVVVVGARLLKLQDHPEEDAMRLRCGPKEGHKIGGWTRTACTTRHRLSEQVELRRL